MDLLGYVKRRIVIQPETGCWIWQKGTNKGGYALYGTNRGGMLYVHRELYQELHPDESIEGLCVCHTCDRRNCVNPEHLYLGTKGQNSRDMAFRKRYNPNRDDKGRFTE